MSSKHFVLITLTLLLVCLIVFGGITAFVDPLFHYHAPLESISYILNNQRYQNDGIMKHFDYNAIIIGSSVTENFKTSDFDRMFQVSSIKVPFSGSYLFETTSRLEDALSLHDVEYVIRSLDYYALLKEKNKLSDFDYPNFLYDNNPFNDVKYVFNKDILINFTLNTLNFSSTSENTTSFDDYSMWRNPIPGKDGIIAARTRPALNTEKQILSSEEADRMIENLHQNIISLANRFPNTEFYYFIPPQSILYWDHHNQNASMDYKLSMIKLAAETLMGYDNIHLFLFTDCYEIVCNMDNYYDLEHYTPEASTRLLEFMSNGEYELTQSSLKTRFDSVYSFLSLYDYDSLYQ